MRFNSLIDSVGGTPLVGLLHLPTDRSPRDLVMAEFHDAITGVRRALHGGRWGAANLEVCEAALASSASGREVMLAHQVAV